MLANELQLMHRANKVVVIPYVLTWDGIVTEYRDTYASGIGVGVGVEMNTRVYIQYVVMKRTVESLSIDFRRRVSLEVS